MPSSCSYKLLDEGKALPHWHHLITNDKESVHKVNQSIKEWAFIKCMYAQRIGMAQIDC